MYLIGSAQKNEEVAEFPNFSSNAADLICFLKNSCRHRRTNHQGKPGVPDQTHTLVPPGEWRLHKGYEPIIYCCEFEDAAPTELEIIFVLFLQQCRTYGAEDGLLTVRCMPEF